MKLTPFILFLILLFVLVISIVFSRFLPLINSKEGFISFKKDTNSLNYVYIPQYSSQTSTSNSTVVKLYDNLFFDTKNANIIEVNGSAFVGNTSSFSSSTNGNVDSLGVSITGIYVVKRDGNKNTDPYTTLLSSDNKVIAKDTEESKISTIPSNYQSWVYNTLSTNTDKYQLFYISWNKDTYVHVIKLSAPTTNIASFMFGTNNIMKQHIYTQDTNISLGNYTQDNDQNNNKKIKISNYANELYQVSKNVKFDCSSGNLIITDETNTSTNYKLYNRNGELLSVNPTTLPTIVPNSDFTPFIVTDSISSTGKNMVLYLPDGQNTVIALIYMDPTTNVFKFGNIVRFSSTGLDNNVTTSTNNVIVSTDNVNSDYYKWLAYWNTSVANNQGNYMNEKIDFNDYMLKTQIVPPVCPTCPSCPSSTNSCSGGVCTNCGGQGGSGTKINNENLGIADATANIAQTGGNVINNTVDNITDLGIGAEVLAAGAGIGAYNLLSNAGGGATDLVKSAGGGATDLVKSAGGGATDLVKSAGSGILSLGKDQQGGYNSGYAANGYRGSGAGYNTGVGAGAGYNTGVGAGAGYNTGVGAGTSAGAGTGADYYSYYGALPNKQSNFIPVTADFSSFSK